MRAQEQAYKRLEAADPLSDAAQKEPTRADAIAFLRSIEEEAMDSQRLADLPKAPARPTRRWPIAVAAFVAVLAAGAAVGFFAGGYVSSPATNAAAQTTSEAPTDEAVVEEPAELAELRAAVNAGDAIGAASIHTGGRGCARFFTTGSEACADWYAFLVGIGTQVTAARCEADSYTGGVGCWWTLESNAHRALGIDSVEWVFTSVSVEGWGTVQPDGNLFSGLPGFAALDDEFWRFVSSELVHREPELAEVVASSNRVPATLNADFATFVLDAAKAFPGPGS